MQIYAQARMTKSHRIPTYSHILTYAVEVDVSNAASRLSWRQRTVSKLPSGALHSRLPSFLPSSVTRNFASFSSLQLSGPLSTLILISRIPPSVDAAGRFFRAIEGVRIAAYTPRADARAAGVHAARAETLPLVITLGVNDSICVHADCRNSRKLMRIRGRYPEGTKRKRIPGARAVCSMRKIRAVLCILARRYLLSQEYLAR